jgi:hypothetical protein
MDTTLPPAPAGDLSPTLDLLPPAQRPAPMPACGRCQLAMWMLVEADLRCYCTSMRVVVWDGVKAPVRACDGQLLPATRKP